MAKEGTEVAYLLRNELVRYNDFLAPEVALSDKLILLYVAKILSRQTSSAKLRVRRKLFEISSISIRNVAQQSWIVFLKCITMN